MHTCTTSSTGPLVNRREIFFTTDIETDGAVPGLSSMLSFGIVPLVPSRDERTLHIQEGFTRNLKRLPDATPLGSTAVWWDEQAPAAYAAHRKDLVDPATAMVDLVKWVERVCLSHEIMGGGTPTLPVFLAGPVGFDFTFIRYYLYRFTGACVFGHSALDVRSYIAGALGTGYRSQVRMPEWKSDLPHNHVALTDAMREAEDFSRVWAWRKRRTYKEELLP